MIVVCGETVTDLLPEPGGEGRFTAVTGGGPANTAVSLARLGSRVAMLARLSTDAFGRAATQRLHDAGVELHLSIESPEPAALAVATLASDGGATYTFYTAGTADFSWREQELPELPAEVTAVHTGSLALLVEPAASAILELLTRQARRCLISIDPNVRPHAGSAEAYLIALRQWLPLADVVKVSDEDMAYLFPGADPVAVAREWAASSTGPALVVVTLGARGAAAAGRFGVVRVEGAPTTVIDTVGAGDAFQAGLLDFLSRAGLLSRPALDRISSSDVAGAIRFANTVASLTCSRRGAQPPRREELSTEALQLPERALP
jgi:fructokinase